MPAWLTGTWNSTEDWSMDSVLNLVDEETGEIIGSVVGETRAGTYTAEYRSRGVGEFVNQKSAIAAVEKANREESDSRTLCGGILTGDDFAIIAKAMSRIFTGRR